MENRNIEAEQDKRDHSTRTLFASAAFLSTNEKFHFLTIRKKSKKQFD